MAGKKKIDYIILSMIVIVAVVAVVALFIILNNGAGRIFSASTGNSAKIPVNSGVQATSPNTVGQAAASSRDNPDSTKVAVGRIQETVTCFFKGATTPQVCISPKVNCTGIASCTASVSGKDGDAISWTSSCGGKAVTIIDGTNENIYFTCTPTPVCGDGIIEPPETCDSYVFLNGMSSCTDLGFSGGILKCNSCKLDTSQCISCTAGYACQSQYYKGYQNADCTWNNATFSYCPNGCKNGNCL